MRKFDVIIMKENGYPELITWRETTAYTCTREGKVKYVLDEEYSFYERGLTLPEANEAYDYAYNKRTERYRDRA